MESYIESVEKQFKKPDFRFRIEDELSEAEKIHRIQTYWMKNEYEYDDGEFKYSVPKPFYF